MAAQRMKDGGLEREFRRSLSRLPGYSMRLYDNGGKPTDTTLLGDFLLFSDGEAYAFECKSTSGASIRLRDPGEKGSGIHAEQLAELARFEREGGTSYVALNYRRTGSLVLLRLDPILAFRKSKKSITEKEALDMGWLQKPHPEGGWRLKVRRADGQIR